MEKLALKKSAQEHQLAVVAAAATVYSAAAMLASAGRMEAPRYVVDALCRWIGEIETAARNVGLLGKKETWLNTLRSKEYRK